MQVHPNRNIFYLRLCRTIGWTPSGYYKHFTSDGDRVRFKNWNPILIIRKQEEEINAIRLNFHLSMQLPELLKMNWHSSEAQFITEEKANQMLRPFIYPCLLNFRWNSIRSNMTNLIMFGDKISSVSRLWFKQSRPRQFRREREREIPAPEAGGGAADEGTGGTSRGEEEAEGFGGSGAGGNGGIVSEEGWEAMSGKKNFKRIFLYVSTDMCSKLFILHCQHDAYYFVIFVSKIVLQFICSPCIENLFPTIDHFVVE